MRPVGDVCKALVMAAERQPGTVRDLAERALVSYGVAGYTVPRLLARGDLVVLDDCRPMVVGVVATTPPRGETLASALARLHCGRAELAAQA